jgi:hypothetical protein
LDINALEEKPMRASTLLVLPVVLLGSCTTTYSGTTSTTVARWEDKGRDISELITTVGPYDTTSVKGDWRSYDWFRFGNCHLVARTSLDGRIQQLTLEGTGSGCNVYLERLDKELSDH